jgi:amino acid adenylation domain-containing protein
LLLRHTGQEDLLVGSPIAGRIRVETEGIFGLFVNTLVLRANMSGNPTFRELLQRVREVALGAYAHQELPFEKLVEELRPERRLGHNPIFQVMFVLQNMPTSGINLGGLTLEPFRIDCELSMFDLSLFMFEVEGQLVANFEYTTDLFESASIQRMAERFRTLLEGIVARPDDRIGFLPLLPASERQQVLREWNATGRPYPRHQCIHQLFEEQARLNPQALALVCGRQGLSYGELNRRANILAHHLRELGIGPEVLVGVCTERRWELVVGLLAVLKAGGGYVPLDPRYPTERLAFMLEDSGAPVLLTQRKLLASLPGYGGQVVYLDEFNWTPSPTDEGSVESMVGPGHLAYVIYTSGSTGRPKGVAIEHCSAVMLIHWAREVYAPEELRGVLFSTSTCFDLSVFELFATLSAGGKVILAENALQLAELPAAEQVTLVNTVPSAMAELVRMGGVPRGVRVVNLAGEPLKPALVDEIYGLGTVAKVYDLYGPSEDTTYSSCALRRLGGVATIGRPIANTQFYLLDRNGQPVPVGVTGEIYIGGEGLTRGYLRRPELTAERFVPNPFNGDRGARLYRTGDLARYRADGNLEFLGRMDHQVKIRGFRVELGEVEAMLAQHPSVKEATACAREDLPGDKRLVAYVVANPGQSALAEELRRFLKEKVPDHMVPAAFVTLERLPLTPSGKVDRRALPAPPEARADVQNDYVAPRTPTERTLVQIWSEVLRVRPLGIHDNFFELGGHSLLAMQVVSRLRDAFQVELPLRSLFECPTVAGLAGRTDAMLWIQPGLVEHAHPQSSGAVSEGEL